MQFWNLWPVSPASFLHNLNGILVKEVKSRSFRNVWARIILLYENFCTVVQCLEKLKKERKKKKDRKWKEFYTYRWPNHSYYIFDKYIGSLEH